MTRIVRDEKGNLYSEEEREKLGFQTFDTLLAYDEKTKQLYFDYSQYAVSFSESTTVGDRVPYISENRKHCRFIDNQIVEMR